MNEFVRVAVEIFGTQKKLGEACGFSQQAAYKWLHGKSKVPPEACVLIEKATNGKVKRSDLRPNDWKNIWPEFSYQPSSEA